MVKFDGLKRDTAYFEKVTNEAADQLEKWIRQNLDSMQGK